jgi:hypothetical protein
MSRNETHVTNISQDFSHHQTIKNHIVSDKTSSICPERKKFFSKTWFCFMMEKVLQNVRDTSVVPLLPRTYKVRMRFTKL